MMQQFYKILQILSDGEYHSGEAIGTKLGLTRAAIWKILHASEKWGLCLESHKRQGYRLPKGFELLSEAAIRQYLKADAQQQFFAIEILPEIDSTNRYLLEKNDASAWHVCLAEYQSRGRGRRGHNWISPFAANIYLSLLWEFSGNISELAGLSLVVGIAVVRVLRRIAKQSINLKWPNDIIVDNHKLAGILIEISGDAAGPCKVVIGVGINVNLSNSKTDIIDQPWVDLTTIMQTTPSRNQVIGLLLNELQAVLHDFQKIGLNGFIHEWQQYDALVSHPIVLQTQRGNISGIANGIDEQGNLLLNQNGQVLRFNSGEVSVRLAE